MCVAQYNLKLFMPFVFLADLMFDSLRYKTAEKYCKIVKGRLSDENFLRYTKRSDSSKTEGHSQQYLFLFFDGAGYCAGLSSSEKLCLKVFFSSTWFQRLC